MPSMVIIWLRHDNLICRGASQGSDSSQTIQDANLLKIQVYYCYELVIPFVNRILWVMMRYSPVDPMPADMPMVEAQHRFGRPASGTFSETCITKKNDKDDYIGIPIRAQGIMRMQSSSLMPASG